MVKAIIVDDEHYCITALQHDIDLFCPEVHVVTTCLSGEEGIEAIKRFKPQLVFLDISMPLMTGFEMLEQLGQHHQLSVIFTTAFDQYMLKALRMSALDYLLKPIDPKQLVGAVERLQKRPLVITTEDRINNLLMNMTQNPDKQKIVLPNREGFDFVSVGDILYCSADGAYTEIIFLNGKKLVVSKSLGEIEQNLPEVKFERIHHSTLINISEIIQVKKSDGFFVVMSNGHKLSVARSKKDKLLAKLRI